MTLASDPANLPQYDSISVPQDEDDDEDNNHDDDDDEDEDDEEEDISCIVCQVNHRFKRNFLKKSVDCTHRHHCHHNRTW